jgi:hypothetical protein
MQQEAEAEAGGVESGDAASYRTWVAAIHFPEFRCSPFVFPHSHTERA